MSRTEVHFSLRRAEPADCDWIGELANEPSVRSASFSSAPIPHEAHCRWFRTRLADPGTAMYVAENGDKAPLGQVRFQIEGDRAVISVSVVPEARGGGFGPRLIREGALRFFADAGVDVIEAYIKKENPASVRAFEKAGFRQVESVSVQGTDAVLAIFSRTQTEREA